MNLSETKKPETIVQLREEIRNLKTQLFILNLLIQKYIPKEILINTNTKINGYSVQNFTQIFFDHFDAFIETKTQDFEMEKAEMRKQIQDLIAENSNLKKQEKKNFESKKKTQNKLYNRTKKWKKWNEDVQNTIKTKVSAKMDVEKKKDKKKENMEEIEERERFAVSCLLSGLGFKKYSEICRTMDWNNMGKTWFQSMAKELSAFIYFKLLKNSQDIFNEIRNDRIIVFFDGRFDSSRDAQFCTIIFMEANLFRVIWVGNLKKKWVDNKPKRMERIGVEQGLKNITCLYNVEEVVHDDDKTINFLLSQKFADLYNSLCVWHVTRNLDKKFVIFVNKKFEGNQKFPNLSQLPETYLSNWIWNALNDSHQDVNLFKRRLFVLPFHLLGFHQLCNYHCKGDPVDPDARPMINLKEFLELLLWLGKNIPDDLCKKLKNFRTTSQNESFNNTLKKTAPKNTYYGKNFQLRVFLPVIEWNLRKSGKVDELESFRKSYLDEFISMTKNEKIELEIKWKVIKKQFKEEVLELHEKYKVELQNRQTQHTQPTRQAKCGCKGNCQGRCSCFKNHISCSPQCNCFKHGNCQNPYNNLQILNVEKFFVDLNQLNEANKKEKLEEFLQQLISTN